MCRVSNKIKFCTCKDGSLDRLKHYWIFHKYDKEWQVDVLGSMVEPFKLDAETNLYNEETLLKRVNEADAFDIDLHPEDKDRLEITISCSEKKDEFLTYGFCFENGQWKPKEYDPFEWQWSHHPRENGKIKNPI